MSPSLSTQPPGTPLHPAPEHPMARNPSPHTPPPVMTPSPSIPIPRSDTLNVVASDHRPFSAKQKAMGREDFTKIPHGVSGVQDRMNIIWERGVVRAGAAAPRVSRGPIPQGSHVLTALPPRRWGAKWMRTASWPSPAPTRPSCTTCTPARAASCPAPTPTWWCGTPRPPGRCGARRWRGRHHGAALSSPLLARQDHLGQHPSAGRGHQPV